jgi:hypothetical protein
MEITRTTISVIKSEDFMRRAYEAWESCAREWYLCNGANTDDNCFSFTAVDSYIMSVTTLEAFMNERLAMNLSMSLDTHRKQIVTFLKEQDIKNKYRMAPILLWGKSYDEGQVPFQDFVPLIDIRNDLIHYKMPFYDGQNRPKWARKMEERGVILPSPVVSGSIRVWIDEISTLRGAQWAYNTVCKMIKQFMEMADELTRIGCEAWVKSLREITDNDWRKYRD